METVGDFLTSNCQQSHFRVRKEYVVHSIMEYHAAIEKAIMFHEIGCRTAVPQFPCSYTRIRRTWNCEDQLGTELKVDKEAV